MIQEEIRLEVNLLQDQIKKSQERIEELQNICNHENTFQGNYSWRVGNIQLAEICCDCRKLIEYLNQ